MIAGTQQDCARAQRGRDRARSRRSFLRRCAFGRGASDMPTISFRVCADPNNLPFSNRAGAGFENKLAEFVAGEARHSTSTYTWWAQRRGFIRNTLKAGDCDVVMGVPARLDMVETTRPYYRSTYVFVSRRGSPLCAAFDQGRAAEGASRSACS